MMECTAKIGRGRARGIRPLKLETLRNIRPLPHAAAGPAAQWAARRPGQLQTSSDECPAELSDETIIKTDTSPEPMQSESMQSESMQSEPMQTEVINNNNDNQDNDSDENKNKCDIMTRPSQWIESKKGISGKPITLRANYLKLIAAPDWCLHKYHVNFEPEENSIAIRKALIGLHQKKFGGYVFNGTVMYSNQRLPNDLTELSGVRQTDKQSIKISIQFIDTLEKLDPIYTQFFNVLLKKAFIHLNLLFVGENIFDLHLKTDINEHNIELWPGYNTSICQHEQDVLMFADITYKIVRKENMLMTLNRIKETYGFENFEAACKAEMIGTTVWVDYNDKSYKIYDIDFSMTPLSKFQSKIQEEQDVTFLEYYQTKNNILINDLKQPLLVTRSSEHNPIRSDDIVYLVPELCRAIGLSDTMKSDSKLMEALAERSRIPVESYAQKIIAISKRFNENPSAVAELTKWNLQLDQQLVTIPGRILPDSKIIFANNLTVEVSGLDPNLNWTSQLKVHGLFRPVLLNNWVIIVPKRLAKNVRGFISCLQQSLNNFQVREPHYIEIIKDSPQSYSNEIDKYLSHTNPQLMFCVIPEDSSDVYSAIKKKCCVDHSVPNQLVSSRCFKPNSMPMIATKVAIQMNCKIGGSPWSVHIPLNSLMIIGFESRRDTSQPDRFFSAMVASLDKHMGRFISKVSTHTDDIGLINNFVINITAALHKFHEINGALPEKIIIYRISVQEEQITNIFLNEISQIQLKLADLYKLPKDDIPMAYVVVNKKVNTHFFTECFGRAVNPPLGTVVDDIITCPTKYDFYISGKTVRNGSATPTLFNVIHDNVALQPDKMQLLTFRLMFMNFNCSGIWHLPGPLQFARKLVKLAAEGIHCEPNSKLGSTLYFL
ncbi:piwi-like protein Siwi [Aphidius gifuensis]|nr:piwi-like protein Siwi [Aphidius gifuensis]